LTRASGASYPATRGRHPTSPDPESVSVASTVVEAGTSVEGEVRGDGDLVVRGSLRGRVAVEGTVRLEPGSDVRADIRAPRVVIVDGAAFQGSLDTLGGEPEAGAPPPEGAAGAEEPFSALRRRIQLRGT
jgi:hypothetical protein